MQVSDDRFQAESGWNSTTCFDCMGVIIRLACKTYIVVEATLMTALGRNMLPSELFHKFVFDGYLFIAYFIAKHNSVHNFKITDKNKVMKRLHQFVSISDSPVTRFADGEAGNLSWRSTEYVRDLGCDSILQI